MKKSFSRWSKKVVKRLRPALRFLEDMDRKNIGVMAAGIAYFTLLAVFPGMAAGMAIALFVLDPPQIAAAMEALELYVPKDITDMLTTILSNQAGQGSNLIMAFLGILLAFFGASGAMQNTAKALNIIFNKKETRSIVHLRVVSIALTVGAVVLSLVIIALLLLTYNQLVWWGVPEWSALVVSLLRWVVLVVVINGALLLLFRYGVNRERTVWRISTPGVATATLLWLAVTIVFFGYLQNYAGFTQSYSVFTGIIALMMWFNLSATAILVGALIDAQK